MMTVDPDDLVLNPGISLKIQGTVRRKNQPLTTFELTDSNRAMVSWLLSVIDAQLGHGSERVEVEIGERALVAAVEAGVLVRRHEVPDAPEPYRCGPEDTILELVEARWKTPAQTIGSSELQLNPRCFFQAGSELPRELRDRIRWGADLWSHLGTGFLPRGPRSFADGSRLLWVEQPSSSILEPIWIPEEMHDEVHGVVEGRRTLESLSSRARRALILANALRAEPPRASDSIGEGDGLQRDGFIVLRNVVSPLTGAALRRHFRALRNSGYFELDTDQVVGMRDGMYCEVACLFLQHQLTRLLSSLLREPVRGSYTWVRRYHPGATLSRHTDRPQCRWNVSFCVDLSPEHERSPWPLYLEVGGAPREVLLDIGDAVVYSGTDIPHWREPLSPGREVTMIFFHYVPDSFTGSLR